MRSCLSFVLYWSVAPYQTHVSNVSFPQHTLYWVLRCWSRWWWLGTILFQWCWRSPWLHGQKWLWFRVRFFMKDTLYGVFLLSISCGTSGTLLSMFQLHSIAFPCSMGRKKRVHTELTMVCLSCPCKYCTWCLIVLQPFAARRLPSGQSSWGEWVRKFLKLWVIFLFYSEYCIFLDLKLVKSRDNQESVTFKN